MCQWYRTDVYRRTMKKISLLALIALLPILCMAEVVSEQEALTIATKFMNAPTVNNAGARINRAPRQLSRINQQVVPNQNFYIFNSADGNGYVVVSADDVARPILGYSDNGNIDVSTMPENMRWWLGEYNAQIEWAKANNLPQSAEIADEWRKVSTGTQQAATVVVGPLLSTTWGQSTPYNNLCPKININNREHTTLTGCVATAMAQIMNYHQWPTHGTGFKSYTTSTHQFQLSVDLSQTTYDWRNMRDSYTNSTSYSNLQANAVATIMYHAGVASNMNYDVNESSTDLRLAGYGLTHYFGYSKALYLLSQQSYSSTTSWILTIQKQLNKGFPVLYGGINPNTDGGHAFVCDGYDSDLRFHFNWGWNGDYDNYFFLLALNPGTNNYTSNQQAIVNIKPDTSDVSYNLQLCDDILSLDTIFQGKPIIKETSIQNVGKLPFFGKIYLAAINRENPSQSYLLDSLNNVNLPPFYAIDVKVEDFSNYNARIVTETIDEHSFGTLETSYIEAGDYALTFLFVDTVNNINGMIGDDYYPNMSPLHVKKSITIRAKMPSNWGNTISAWVWEKGGHRGDLVSLTKNGEWYEYTGATDELSIIFVNGDGSSESENDYSESIFLTESACVQLSNNTSGMRTYTIVNCDGDDTQEYYIVAKRNAGNYYFLTPTKVQGKNRLVAVDAGSGVRTNIDTINTTADYLWTIEDGMLKNHNGQYLSCTAAKNAVMANSGILLNKTDNADGTVTFSYAASETETRYLSLATTGNDFFVFYANTNQFTHLLMLPKGGVSTSLEDVEPMPSVQQSLKVFENGQLYIILPDGTRYSATGQKVK